MCEQTAADVHHQQAAGSHGGAPAGAHDGTAIGSSGAADAPAGHVAAEVPPCFVQGALDGLAQPLAQAEFVVVDLETTGGSPATAGITELAAIRTRGRASLPPHPAGPEFTTLVNPGCAIPPHVAMLTGITDALVAAAPRIADVLPRFLDFAAGAVLVAHNAPFDIGFLTAACRAHGVSWPRLPTLDTAALARHMLTTDEVRDCKLGTLAEFFGAATRPRHRALDDARATTAVLHGLIGRLAERGVHTLEELRGFARRPVPAQRRMRQLTAGIPRTPGVCMFTAADGRVLHVVRSSDMQARACGYFAAAETRHQVREMVDKTTRILPLSCATALEAEVAEIRLTALHRPPYTSEPDDGLPDPRAGAGGGALAAVPLLVAARPRFSGGWDVAWIRYGRLEGTTVVARAGAAAPAAALAPAARCGIPAAAATAQQAETACLLGWLLSPGVRLIEVDGSWCSTVEKVEEVTRDRPE